MLAAVINHNNSMSDNVSFTVSSVRTKKIAGLNSTIDDVPTKSGAIKLSPSEKRRIKSDHTPESSLKSTKAGSGVTSSLSKMTSPLGKPANQW